MKATTKIPTIKGFKPLTVEEANSVWGYNNEIISNGDEGIAFDKNKIIIKCGCGNCGGISTVYLTKAQIKKINTILNTK